MKMKSPVVRPDLSCTLTSAPAFKIAIVHFNPPRNAEYMTQIICEFQLLLSKTLRGVQPSVESALVTSPFFSAITFKHPHFLFFDATKAQIISMKL